MPAEDLTYSIIIIIIIIIYLPRVIMHTPGTLLMIQCEACSPVSGWVKSLRLSFFGYLAHTAPRQYHHHVIATALRQPANWRRPIRRPRTTWLRTIDDDLQYLNFGSTGLGGRQKIGTFGIKPAVWQCVEFANKERRRFTTGHLTVITIIIIVVVVVIDVIYVIVTAVIIVIIIVFIVIIIMDVFNVAQIVTYF